MATYSNETSKVIDMWFRRFGCYYHILLETEVDTNALSIIKTKMLKEKIFFIITLSIIFITILSNLIFIYGLWKTVLHSKRFILFVHEHYNGFRTVPCDSGQFYTLHNFSTSFSCHYKAIQIDKLQEIYPVFDF